MDWSSCEQFLTSSNNCLLCFFKKLSVLLSFLVLHYHLWTVVQKLRQKDCKLYFCAVFAAFLCVIFEWRKARARCFFFFFVVVVVVGLPDDLAEKFLVQKKDWLTSSWDAGSTFLWVFFVVHPDLFLFHLRSVCTRSLLLQLGSELSLKFFPLPCSFQVPPRVLSAFTIDTSLTASAFSFGVASWVEFYFFRGATSHSSSVAFNRHFQVTVGCCAAGSSYSKKTTWLTIYTLDVALPDCRLEMVKSSTASPRVVNWTGLKSCTNSHKKAPTCVVLSRSPNLTQMAVEITCINARRSRGSFHCHLFEAMILCR